MTTASVNGASFRKTARSLTTGVAAAAVLAMTGCGSTHYLLTQDAKDNVFALQGAHTDEQFKRDDATCRGFANQMVTPIIDEAKQTVGEDVMKMTAVNGVFWAMAGRSGGTVPPTQYDGSYTHPVFGKGAAYGSAMGAAGGVNTYDRYKPVVQDYYRGFYRPCMTEKGYEVLQYNN